MEAENSSKAAPAQQPDRKSKKRLVKWLLLVVCALIAAVLVGVPLYVSSEGGRRTILAKINDFIDGRTDFADLSMGWFRGVTITDFSFDDAAGQTKVRIRQIAAKPHYASILTGGLSFGRTVIDEPTIQISLTPAPPQVSRPSVGPTSLPGQTKPVALPVKRVDLFVNNGKVKITDAKSRTVELSGINSNVTLRPPGRKTSFNVDMVVVDDDKRSRISAEGELVPERKTGWSLEGVSGDLTVEVNELDIGSLGPLFALAGVDVQAEGSISARVNSRVKDGGLESLTASITGRNLDVNVPALSGDKFKTDALDVTAKLQADKELINIDSLGIQTDWLKIDAAGVVPKTFDSLAEFIGADSAYDLKASFECDLAAAMSQMPATFGLKEGTQITGGRLTGSIETTRVAGRRKITGRCVLADLAGTVEGRRAALSQAVTAEAEITSERTGINYDKLQLVSSFGQIRCTGTGELLRYDADADLGKLQEQLGQFVDMGRYQITGRLSSKGEISGDESKILVKGSSAISDFRLSLPGKGDAFEPEANLAFAFDIDRQNKTVNIDSMEANAAFGRIIIKDAVLPLDKETQEPVSLAVSARIDLHRLEPLLIVFASLPKQVRLAGTAESDISVTSEKGIYHIKTRATKIKNLKVTYPEKEPFEQQEVSLLADVRYNPADKTCAVKWQLESPQIKITGDFEKTIKGGATRLEGRADCEYDWATVSKMASAFLPSGLKMTGRRKDAVTFSSRYQTDQPNKLLANLNTEAKLGFEKAEYMGLDFSPTEVDVQAQKGLLTIAPFSTTVNNGRLSFAATADLKRKPVLLTTPGPIEVAKDIQINDETTRELLMYVNPVFANVLNVSGVVNFNCERLAIPLGGAARDDIEVVGTISMNQVRLEASDLLGQILSVIGTGRGGEVITVHPTKFVLQNGFLKYDDMQMDVGGYPINFKGVIGLDKSLDMLVTLPYTSRGRTVKIGRETPAERVTVKLRGTLNKPELDIADLLGRELLGEKIKEEIGEELGEKALEILDELFK